MHRLVIFQVDSKRNTMLTSFMRRVLAAVNGLGD
jgi:hypothetical protein